jgi:predicted transcriptional regulator of viral defense system
MKSSKNLIEQLKTLSYFNKAIINQFGDRLGLKKTTINTYISRFLKRKEIIRLKNGLYVSADFFDKNKSDNSYLFFLANIIRQPSYISSWTALQYYNLSTEAVYQIISITPKVTRNYRIKAGDFVFQSIKKDLFCDFFLVKGNFDFFIASPAKALFDLLYFRTHQFRGINLGDIKKIIEELRINIDEMDEVEREKFYSMVKKSI